MITRGEAIIDLPKGQRFSPTIAASLKGQTTKEGWLVIDAVRVNDHAVRLTLEKEIESEEEIANGRQA